MLLNLKINITRILNNKIQAVDKDFELEKFSLKWSKRTSSYIISTKLSIRISSLYLLKKANKIIIFKVTKIYCFKTDSILDYLLNYIFKVEPSNLFLFSHLVNL